MGNSLSCPDSTLDSDAQGAASQVHEQFSSKVSLYEGISRKEKKIVGSNDPMEVKKITEASRAVGKIMVENRTATGFLAKFPALDGSLLYGIFTNNHVLSEHDLTEGKSFKVQFDNVGIEGVPFVTSITIAKGDFRFTCAVLDATFVRFEDAFVENQLLPVGCQFLEVLSNWEGSANTELFMLQHPGGNQISVAQGNFLQYNGQDFFHTVSTECGSSGSPVALSSGQVIGIHKARSAHNSSNYNVAVAMKAVIEAILPFLSHKIAPILVRNQISLHPQYETKIVKLGLKKCKSGFDGPTYNCSADNSDSVFWFIPTIHGWYWSPNDPLNEHKETNWMAVSQSNVIGDGENPTANITEIITWLFQNNINCNVPVH